MPTRPLDRLMFAQGGLCFFCKDPIAKADASVEHLVASANGGRNDDDNCVVCCKAMNALLGSMSLKEKIQVVLNQKGHFKCPNGSQKPAAKASPAGTKPKAAKDRYGVVVSNLRQRGAAKPKTVKTLTSTIRSLFQKDITDKELSTILQQLESEGVVTIEGAKVAYA
ncbi:MAG: HNH endonuclease [Betaproteobacteria bacterium]|nr:HNH endonuclease [Betaproteobacteria bacterium]MDH5351404.1 HNH endonuclease [Betaproteobacteria bacterium]